MSSGQSVRRNKRGSVMHYKGAKHASLDDIGQAAMCTAESDKYYVNRH